MSWKETAFQVVVLVFLSVASAGIELAVIGLPPDYVILVDDDLAKEIAARKLERQKQNSDPGLDLDIDIGKYKSVSEYCLDGKCDVEGLNLIIYITHKKARALYESGEAQFVDARESEKFQKEHIPFSVNLPVTDFTSGWPEDMELLMKEMDTVVYCDGAGCDASQIVAKHLVKNGFRKLKIIQSGFPGWKEAGFDVEPGQGATDE